jgi:hypothetical protein
MLLAQKDGARREILIMTNTATVLAVHRIRNSRRDDISRLSAKLFVRSEKYERLSAVR